MGLMLNLISLTPNISAFLIQISHKRPYAEGIVIILKPHSRRKNDVKFVNKDMLINNLRTWGKPMAKTSSKNSRFYQLNPFSYRIQNFYIYKIYMHILYIYIYI